MTDIVTLTPNPAVDVAITVDTIRPAFNEGTELCRPEDVVRLGELVVMDAL